MNPDDQVVRWLQDRLSGARNVLESADRFQWTAEQRRALSSEVSFYKRLLEIVEGQVTEEAVPRPPQHVLDGMRKGLKRWEGVVQWSENAQQEHASWSADQRRRGELIAQQVSRLRDTLRRF